MKFHGGKGIADKHFMSVIDDAGISEKSSHNFIACKKARGQARKVILNAKRNLFHQFTPTTNRITPLSQVWNIISILHDKKKNNPINLLTINDSTADDLKAIASTVARHFNEAAS